MAIHVELSEDQSIRLVQLANYLRVDPTELARAAINDLVSRTGNDFENAATRVLEKNQELYRRLSQ